MQSWGLPSPHPARPSRRVLVIGAGLVGLSIAWLLCRRGHAVTLVDSGSSADESGDDPAGSRASEAALGVLMGRVFHRSSGRGWRLRQQSLELWAAWRQDLAARGRPLPWREGLLLLAADAQDLERQHTLLHDPRRQTDDPRVALQWWRPERLGALRPQLPAALGGLYSPGDGQLDPLPALRLLAEDAEAAGLIRRQTWATALRQAETGWALELAGGERISADWVVLAAGLGSNALLPEGLRCAAPALEPVLGQALELELDPADRPRAETAPWPGAIVWRGINLIARPCRLEPEAPWRLWLGATLEPGREAAAEPLARLRDLGGEAPDWLRRARPVRQWQGLRARPRGEAAPLLRELAGGLLLATGHYRNGVLLAPASAAWVAERLEGGTEAA